MWSRLDQPADSSSHGFSREEGNVAVAMETPATEHPLCQELTTLISEGLTPNEVYGTLAVIKSMRRNKKCHDEDGSQRRYRALLPSMRKERDGRTTTCWTSGIFKKSIFQETLTSLRILFRGICYGQE